MYDADLALIHTKLIMPPWRPTWVPRARLFAALVANPSVRLALFCAPAGFGKTTSMIDWCLARANRGAAIAWYSLDDSDNDPVRFAAYLAASLKQALGRNDLSAAIAAAAVDPAAVVAPLINALAQGGSPVVLVLDDYQMITTPVIHVLIGMLLERAPETLQIVVGSRADPPLPLSRLRVRGQLVELRAADLQFSSAEIGQFFASAVRAPLGEQTIALLERWTEGWAAGLQLVALTLPAQLLSAGDQEVEAIQTRVVRSQRQVFEYLADEVLAQQPEDLQRFLLETAILDRLSGELCTAVTGRSDAAYLLEQLEAHNLFLISLDAERNWYRYHHLFADFLRHRLRQRQPDPSRELHCRAAHWYTTQGTVVEAIDHALKGQDFELAANLFVEKAWIPLTARAELAMILQWIPAFPDQFLREHPQLTLLLARAYFLAGQADNAGSYFERAAQAIDDLPAAHPERSALHRLWLIYRATLAAYRGEIRQALVWADAAEETNDARDMLGEVRIQATIGLCHNMTGDVTAAQAAYGRALFAAQKAGHLSLAFDAIHHLAVADVFAGRLRVAARLCEDALAPFSAEGKGLQPLGMAMTALSQVYYQWNDLARAEELLAQSLDLARQSGHGDLLWIARIYLIPVRRAQHDAAALLALAQTMEHTAQTHPSRYIASRLAAARASALLALGRHTEVRRWAEAYLRSPEPEFSREAEEFVVARVLLADRQAAVALPRLQAGLAAAEEAGRMGSAIEWRVLQAQALDAMGHTRAALVTLQTALEAAEPEGYVRIFIEDGAPMLSLLAIARDHPILPAYVARLLAASGPPRVADAPAGIHPDDALTERESEIIHLIAGGASNQDVADALFITVGTVKSHLNRIFGKLAARNRTEAVAHARALGILKNE